MAHFSVSLAVALAQPLGLLFMLYYAQFATNTCNMQLIIIINLRAQIIIIKKYQPSNGGEG